MAVERMKPETAREHLKSNDDDTMLVCAYDSEEKFENNHLEGAIPLSDFESNADSLDKDRELIFYCA